MSRKCFSIAKKCSFVLIMIFVVYGSYAQALGYDALAENGNVVIDVLQRGYDHLLYNRNFEDSLIFSFDDKGYRNAKGHVLTEKDIFRLPADSSFKRDGITADGNTRLLLRAQLSPIPPGVNINNLEAEFSILSMNETPMDISLESLSREQRGNGTIKIKFTRVEDGVFQATAVLVAPEYMKETNNDDVRFVATVSVTGAEGEHFAQTQALRICQPPVVLIHGLWGSPRESWGKRVSVPSGGVLQQLISRGYICGSYGYPGVIGPLVHMTQNNNDLHSSIVLALVSQVEEFNVACSQVDLVVHSMGGLMARRFLYDNNWYLGYDNKYLNAFNYQNGSVRRLVTIGTPHNGSQLADIAIRRPQYIPNFDVANNQLHQEGYIAIVGQIHKFRPVYIDDESIPAWERKVFPAIEDLTQYSSLGFIPNINAAAPLPPVPMHCIAGVTNDDYIVLGLGSWYLKEKTQKHYGIPVNDVHDAIFGGPSDAVVAVDSAHFPVLNNALARFATLPPSDDFIHTSLQHNNVIAAQVLKVLTSDLENFTKPGPKKSPGAPSVFGNLAPQALPSSEVKMKKGENMAATDSGFQLSSSHMIATTGDLVKFTLSIPSSITGAIIAIGIEVYEPFDVVSEFEMTKLSDFVYELDYRVAGETSGMLGAIASVFTVQNGAPEDWHVSNIAGFAVIPKMNELSSMKIIPYKSLIMFAGDEQQADVLGAFSDGYERIINEGLMGTTYEITGDAGIASVNEDGMIKALKEGKGSLIARNGSISATAGIMVLRPVDATPDPDPDNKIKEIGCNSATGYIVFIFTAFPLLFRKRK